MVMAIVTTMVAIQNQALVVAVVVKRAWIEFNIHKPNKAVSGLKSGTVFSFYENGQIDFWHFSAKIGVSMKKRDFYERNRMVRLFRNNQ